MKRSIRSRAPGASSELVRRVMQANPPRDTAPETVLRGTLHRIGLRFRKDIRPEHSIKCKADVVFTGARVCVFIDGCFWHGCPRHFSLPKTHCAWWQEKIADNRARDRRQSRALRSAGWHVVRLWEHQITPERLPVLADQIEQLVHRWGSGGPEPARWPRV